MYTHLIITRFNLDFSTIPSSDPCYSGYQRTAVWDKSREDHRLYLLENITGQTILSQTNKNFRWLLACNPNTSPELRHKLELLSQKIGFTPYFIEPWLENIANVGKNLCQKSGHDFLITTRLDADDGISTDFVALVQEEFCKQDFEFISFNLGLQKNLEDSEAFPFCYWGKSTYNNFKSLIERADNPKTVYCATLGIDCPTVRTINNIHPVWLKILHGDNVATAHVDYPKNGENNELEAWFITKNGG